MSHDNIILLEKKTPDEVQYGSFRQNAKMPNAKCQMPKCHKAKIAALAFGIMAFGGIVGLSETGQKAAAMTG